MEYEKSIKKTFKRLHDSKKSIIFQMMELFPDLIISGSIALSCFGIIDRDFKDIDLTLPKDKVKELIENLRSKNFGVQLNIEDPDPEQEYPTLESITDDNIKKIRRIKLIISQSPLILKDRLFDEAQMKTETVVDIFINEEVQKKQIQYMGVKMSVSLPGLIFKAKKSYIKSYEDKFGKDSEKLKYNKSYIKHKQDLAKYNKWKFKNILSI